jgi:hypothetical protein
VQKITSAEPLDKQLLLIYADGDRVLVDFRPVIAEGSLFTQLDDPDFFGAVRVAPNGRSVSWPGDLEFCADALRKLGRASAGQSRVRVPVVSSPRRSSR